MKTLDMSDGSYHALASHNPFPINFISGLSNVNAVGISPIDSKAYGILVKNIHNYLSCTYLHLPNNFIE